MHYNYSVMENTSNTSDNNQPQNVELGALWKRKARSDGQVYLAGHVKVGSEDDAKVVKVVVFSNKNKNKDNQPDYRVYESKPYTPPGETGEEVVAQTAETSEELL